MNSNMIIFVTIAITFITTTICQETIRVYINLEDTIEDYDSAQIDIVSNNIAADRYQDI